MRPSSAFRILVIRRSSVVLPAPFGPISPTISLRASSKLTEFTAVSPPKRLVSRSARKNAEVIPLEYRVDEKFLDRMGSELAGWTDPVARLRLAIQKNEFELFCQPIMSLSAAGGYPMGEVLVRMREEERALLPPGEFLPVMEHYHMMPQLDRWVVRNTVRHLAGGSRLRRCTVNLSGQTLEDREFVDFVGAELIANGVAPDSLAFEIDESDTLARLPAVEQFTAAYRVLGGKLLVDGFGHRSVSFAAIKALGLDFVKVDGSIVRKLLTSEVARSKMNAIVRVGEALRFSIVGECVEEQDVALRLKALGVGYAQGFGIYQPHPIATFKAP